LKKKYLKEGTGLNKYSQGQRFSLLVGSPFRKIPAMALATDNRKTF
jgi:hypothetical protein